MEKIDLPIHYIKVHALPQISLSTTKESSLSIFFYCYFAESERIILVLSNLPYSQS